MGIFPIFDEFLPYFPFQLSMLTFFTQFHGYSKFFRSFAPFAPFSCNFMLKMEKTLALRSIWKMSWRLLLMSARKNREDIVMFLFEEGGKLELLAKIFTLGGEGIVSKREKACKGWEGLKKSAKSKKFKVLSILCCSLACWNLRTLQ